MIIEVFANYYQPNFFNDGNELRHDSSYSRNIDEAYIRRVINKQVRMSKSGDNNVVLFFKVGMHEDYRVMYDTYAGQRRYMVRHYQDTRTDSWDWEREMTPTSVKQLLCKHIGN